MKKDIVIGMGEVGSAIYKCYKDKKDVIKYDLGYDLGIRIGNMDKIRAMHICYGYLVKKKFIETTMNYILDINPDIVIIHSTVPVGTCREIYDKTRKVRLKTIISHSPIIGVHPNLYDSIKNRFTKFYSVLPNSDKSCNIVGTIFNDDMSIGSIQYFKKIEATELAKIMSTTRYANYIAIATEMKRVCDEYKVDFDEVYTEWEHNYNASYKDLGMSHVVRPILKPCKDKILGHCLRENGRIIRKYMKKTWLINIKPKMMFYLK